LKFFENKKELRKEIFESFSKEKAAANPNYPLIRKYFKEANNNLKSLLLYGLDNYPGRIDLLSQISDHQQSVAPAPSRGQPHTPSSAGGR
jgi:hypothetical protein